MAFKNELWEYDEWRASLLFHDGGPYHMETSPDLQSKSMDWFLYDRDLRRERANALLLVCIHQDIFIDYDKIIVIYASKYPRQVLLINLLREN